MPGYGTDFANSFRAVYFRAVAVSMKMIIGFVLIGLLVGVSTGRFHPAFTTLDGLDSSTLVNAMDDAINCAGTVIEHLSAIYHDFVASSRIVYFFEHTLLPGQKPGTIVLLGCGLAGVWGYGRIRRPGSR
jgi:hypothetical protein